MGHSRQEGGFSEAPQKPLEGFPEIPTADALRQRPDPRADMSGPRAGLEALRPDFVPNEIFTPYRPPRPEKSEGGRPLRIVSDFEPRGDQPQAIGDLVSGVDAAELHQVLLLVTGSGKTFTMPKVIELIQRPT